MDATDRNDCFAAQSCRSGRGKRTSAFGVNSADSAATARIGWGPLSAAFPRLAKSQGRSPARSRCLLQSRSAGSNQSVVPVAELQFFKRDKSVSVANDWRRGTTCRSARSLHRQRWSRGCPRPIARETPMSATMTTDRFSRMPRPAALVAARPGGNSVLRRPPC